MEGIFISYRREESAGHAGRIYDRLRERFGRERVFMDVSAIEPGVDFVEAIDRAVGSCTVLLVVIGRKWLDCTDAAGRRRLDDKSDFIRLEVGTALRRNIRVIPVLVQNAAMPGEADLTDDLKLLARRNAIDINDTHWDTDLAQLVETLSRVLEGTGAAALPGGTGTGSGTGTGTGTKPVSGVQKSRLVWLISSITAVLLALTGLLTGVESFRNSFVRLFKGTPEVATTTDSPATVSTVPLSGQKPTIPVTVIMPRVIGLPQQEAAERIHIAGLQAKIEQRISSVDRPGTVFHQDPVEGARIPEGSGVILHVAKPPKQTEAEMATVPNVVRQTLERAVQMLTEAGLRPGTETPRPTDKVRPGMILDQKIKAGSTVKRGTQVDLLVAVPPAADDTPTGEPATPKVLARGALEVRQTYLFDLDSGRIVRDGDADFWFEAVTATERYLTPRNGAVIGFTREKATFESCSRVKMTERRIPIQRVPENYNVCARTSRGNLASFRLRAPVGPSPGIMKISYITWERGK